MNFYDLLAGPVKRFPAVVWAAIGNGDFRYRVPDSKEQAEIQLRVAKYLENGVGSNVSETEASSSRQQLWDRCYAEAQTLPPFLIKADKEPIRLGGHYVIPESRLFEAHFLEVARAYLFDKFFSNVPEVAEFGCGTGHNLLALARQQSGKVMFGLDWSASALDHVNALRSQFGISLHAAEFDLFNPRRDLHFNLKEVGVLTIGALEQVGKRFEEFLYFLLSRRPPIVVHLEPVLELYDEAQPFDQLAIRYHQARGYLEGYLPALQRLERYGLIEILALHRIPFGSFYHEAYTYIVWRPTRG